MKAVHARYVLQYTFADRQLDCLDTEQVCDVEQLKLGLIVYLWGQFGRDHLWKLMQGIFGSQCRRLLWS